MAQKANVPFWAAKNTSSRCPVPYVAGSQLNAKLSASLLILNPHAEPVKGAVSFIFSALLNWLTIGVIHLPFKHFYPPAIHLERGIV